MTNIKTSKTTKILTVFVMLLAAIVFSSLGKGERFTAQDGMFLYKACIDGKEFSNQDILILYGERETFFKDFLLNK